MTYDSQLRRDTYVERVPGETANDRNDRAIRVAAQWYDKHLLLSQAEDSAERVRVILLTDDKKNREKATEENILCCSVGDYVKALDKHPALQDKLSHKDYSAAVEKQAIFPPHLTLTEIHDGIKGGKLLQGSFMASRENYLEGSVNVEGYEKFVSFDCFSLPFNSTTNESGLASYILWLRFSYKDTKVSIVLLMVTLWPSNCSLKTSGRRPAMSFCRTTTKIRVMC